MGTATINGKPVHPAVPGSPQEARAGKLSRREFLAIATALGVTGAAAYGMLGLACRPPRAPRTPARPAARSRSPRR